MRSIIRIVTLAVALAAAATSASAQELRFGDIAWGTPADSVRARLEAAGFAYRGVVGRGDRGFTRVDGAYITAFMRADRAVGFNVVDAARGDAIPARYRALADSLQAILGAPLESNPEMRVWQTGLTGVGALIYRDPQSGDRVIETEWHGPGWYDEMARRGEGMNLVELPAAYTIVSQRGGMRVSVDTSSLQRRTSGLRARFRIDYPRPVVDGDDRYDAIEYGMDFDCSGGRTRLVSRTTYLGTRRGRSDSADGLPWVPARAGSDGASGLDAVCRVGGSGPVVVAAAEQRTFGAVPAGWLVLMQSAEGRVMLDSGSVAARPSGTFVARVRVDWGRTRTSPWGPTDGMLTQAEIDCAGGRIHFVSAINTMSGRDVHAMAVPSEQAEWHRNTDYPALGEAVCRIGQVRKP
jgi:hypothetical protein